MRTRSDETERVLVVDDDADMRDVVKYALQPDGYDFEVLDNGHDFERMVEKFDPQLIVLDIQLNGANGLDLLTRMRSSGDERPVVLLTSYTDERDRVRGLDLGADDYITKPFSLSELASRVRAVLRRYRRSYGAAQVLRFGDLEINPSARIAKVKGFPLTLTRLEFGVLLHLAATPGTAFSRAELLNDVWQSEAGWQDPETVTEHVRRLRVKLREAGGDDPITTLRGVGYRFDA